MSDPTSDARKEWGDGPWTSEPDHLNFEAHGLPCMLNRTNMGNWCGYVAVPPGHPAHGKGYDDVDVHVHGGLTYAEACQGVLCHVPKPGEPDNVWWLGFDCAHLGDLVPSMNRARTTFLSGTRGEVYRDQAYVTEQTTQLAKQLAEMAE